MLERKSVRVPLYILISFFSLIFGSILGFLAMLRFFMILPYLFVLFLPMLITAAIEMLLMIPFLLRGYWKGPVIATVITSFLAMFGAALIEIVVALIGNS
ncbi:hypothetical protein [Acidianus manzaensis]|uniref:Uncharacterized protein n=1 Tax=Acidianus manzaensis TaxID=282676 RepID=A0A1W6K1L6_9CREN|nr:hypothetical protein [Acidianus manzaensis]ARM76399.1 hypothetical protein B6F84_10460 [Acidianus manzaensis]